MGISTKSVQAFPEGQDFLDLLTNIGLKKRVMQKTFVRDCVLFTPLQSSRSTSMFNIPINFSGSKRVFQL